MQLETTTLYSLGSEPHKRPPSRRRCYGVPRRRFSRGGSGAQGSPRATSRPASAKATAARR